jgi:hypothetical protein
MRITLLVLNTISATCFSGRLCFLTRPCFSYFFIPTQGISAIRLDILDRTFDIQDLQAKEGKVLESSRSRETVLEFGQLEGPNKNSKELEGAPEFDRARKTRGGSIDSSILLMLSNA